MKKRRKVWIIIGSIVILAAVFIAIVIGSSQKNLERLAGEAIPDIDLSEISDGLYEGSCSVFPVFVKVEVVVEGHTITDIDLVEHKNGKGSAAEAIPDMVVKAQSLEVDSISGATYSSKAILKAIKGALTTP